MLDQRAHVGGRAACGNCREVNPHRRYMQSCNSQNSTAVPLSLADRIERMGRALTAAELASMLTVSRITIFKQAKAGRIPSFRIGPCVRFDTSAVAQWRRRRSLARYLSKSTYAES